MAPVVSSDRRWGRYTVSHQMNRQAPSTPEGKTIAAAWHKSGNNTQGPTVPFQIGTVLLVPYRPSPPNQFWGWNTSIPSVRIS
jgi:hypothetical protein